MKNTNKFLQCKVKAEKVSSIIICHQKKKFNYVFIGEISHHGSQTFILVFPYPKDARGVSVTAKAGYQQYVENDAIQYMCVQVANRLDGQPPKLYR